MNEPEFVRILASVVLASAPIIIAVVGETITERSGIVNLSLDETIVLNQTKIHIIPFYRMLESDYF